MMSLLVKVDVSLEIWFYVEKQKHNLVEIACSALPKVEEP